MRILPLPLSRPIHPTSAALVLPTQGPYNTLSFKLFTAGYFLNTTSVDRRAYYALPVTYGIELFESSTQDYHAVIDFDLFFTRIDGTNNIHIAIIKDVGAYNWRYHTFNGVDLYQSIPLNRTMSISGQFILQSDAKDFGVLLVNNQFIQNPVIDIRITYVQGRTP